MNPEDTWNKTTPSPTTERFLTMPAEVVSLSTIQATLEKTDSLPIIISLICIFLLLATCLIFVTLCKPAALDQSRYGPSECMPHHPEDASEPQLRLWKRLGSLRSSISSFRRSRPISQQQRTCSRRPPGNQDWDFMESTKM
ncbi:uncharacterized protein C10orf105 homolog [Rhinatrema bivittatum]|uniref:uncharacterized protein C10orf105 homolog n=1 Tax=Rhinatrema bivittatum TaxID=194408 RepID=UPI001128047D|nr:uncharacterized protein C10orf105 homolog [Rhinatrema bivittatum]